MCLREIVEFDALSFMFITFANSSELLIVCININLAKL